MVKMLLRWLMPIAALVLLGPIVGRTIAALRASDGGTDVSFLTGADPIAGILALILVGVFGVVAAAGSASVVGFRPGLTIAGFVVAWGAWFTGENGMIFRRDGAGAVVPMAIEGGLVALVGAAIVIASAWAGRRHERDSERPMLPQLGRSLTTKAGLVASAAAGAAGLVVAWVVARDDMRGQAIFAAFVGGIVAGMVGAQMAPDSEDAPPMAAGGVTGMLALALIAPAIAFVRPGLGGIAAAAESGALPGALRLQPLDWLVGVLLGVPVGMGWAGALGEEHGHVAAPEQG